MGVETDFSGYRNGSEQTSAHTKTNFSGNQKSRVGYDRNDPNKIMYVWVGRYVGRYICRKGGDIVFPIISP